MPKPSQCCVLPDTTVYNFSGINARGAQEGEGRGGGGYGLGWGSHQEALAGLAAGKAGKVGGGLYTVETLLTNVEMILKAHPAPF